jgi:hypothetical protein
MKTKILLFLLATSLLVSCEKSIDTTNQIKDAGLILNEAEIIETKEYKGIFRGVNFDRNEIYIETPPTGENTHKIEIIDIRDNKTLKTIKLRRGEFQSPTDVYSPSYMQFLNKRYYIIDQFHKILVFDQNLNYLYTRMFKSAKNRYFIDFFHRGGNTFFVIGEKHFGPEESKCYFNIFKIIEKKKMELYKKIHETSHKSNNYTRRTRNVIKGAIWPSTWGFEKDGKIYFCNGEEKQYYVYDLDSKNLECIKVDFLKGKRLSNKDAERIIYDIYKSGDMYEEIKKKHNTSFKFISYPGMIYYFGFYDVGENKLGIAGDIDLERLAFRLDIVKIDSKEYVESIWLPIGYDFLRTLDENYTGLFQSEINIDKGIFVYTDYEGENEEFFVKLLRFRISRK